MKSPLTIIFITIFVDLLGFGMIIPVLPFYAEHFGASFFTIGLLSMSYSLMHFLFAPLWGRLSDRHGRRPIILISLSGSATAFLLFGLASNLVWLFAARILAGVLQSAAVPTAQAFIADTTTKENRAKGMGLIGAAFGLGFIFGPAIGGLLSGYGFATPAYLAAGLSGLNFIWALFKLPETHKNPIHHSYEHGYFSLGAMRYALHTPALVFLVALFFVQVYAFSNMEATFALFCEHRAGLDAFHVGLLLAEVGVLSALVQGIFIGKLTKRFGEIRLLLVGFALMAVGMFSTTGVNSMLSMALIVPFYALGSSLVNPSASSLLSQAADDTKQGLTMGVAQGFGAFGRVLGPPTGTGLFEWVTPGAPYMFGGFLMAISLFVSLRWLRKMPGMPQIK